MASSIAIQTQGLEQTCKAEPIGQVIEDIQEECAKYGQILAISVPRPADPSQSAQVFGQGNFGKVRHFLTNSTLQTWR